MGCRRDPRPARDPHGRAAGSDPGGRGQNRRVIELFRAAALNQQPPLALARTLTCVKRRTEEGRAARQGVDQLLHPSVHRGEDGPLGRLKLACVWPLTASFFFAAALILARISRCAPTCRESASRIRSPSLQAWQHGAGAQLRGVAAKDAAQQRVGQPVYGLAAKVALDERGHRLVVIAGRADAAVPDPCESLSAG